MKYLSDSKPGDRILLMGNEAFARGAIEAGVQLVAAYPGTPSSEITGTLIELSKHYNYHVEWSINEKVAIDIGAGAAIIGARVLVPMKNAGINVAMDTLLTLNYGGIKGGMVIIVCDDPSAHYSSNEQDSRFAAIAGELPCFEPKDQQEAKDMVRDAFELSELLELPVIVRSVSRLSHGNGDVVLGEINEKENPLGFNKHWKMPWRWNVYGPPGAVAKHRWLNNQLKEAESYANKTPFNKLLEVSNKKYKMGIISAGLASAYTWEALRELNVELNILYLGMSFPNPTRKVEDLLTTVESLLVIEEGSGRIVEGKVRAIAQSIGFTGPIYGKEYIPVLEVVGELNTTIVKDVICNLLDIKPAGEITNDRKELKNQINKLVVPRSSTLCAGCPHLGTYTALKKVLKKNKGLHILNVDIGCYEQAGYGISAHQIEANDEDAKKYNTKSTYEMLDTCYVMGSSLGMAEGQDKVGYKDGHIYAIAGDSTFFHAIMPAIVNGVYQNANVTFLILDNYWTAMTGHQPNPATGLSSTGNTTPVMNIMEVVKSLGTPFLKEANAYELEELEKTLDEAANFQGFSVVVIRGECRIPYLKKYGQNLQKSSVNPEKCINCKMCIDIGCPAICYDKDKQKPWINSTMCVGCGICNQVCPVGAIQLEGGAADERN